MYTLADVTRLTGAKRRAVQFWAESGAIVADPATEREGSGVHRTFSRDEVLIACVLAAFALDNAPIGVLIKVGNTMRVLLTIGEHRSQIYNTIHGSERWILVQDKISGGAFYPINKGASFDEFYLNTNMNNENVKANIVYLNGCFARLRSEPDFISI